jgi:Down syndrome cell adhesion protein 1
MVRWRLSDVVLCHRTQKEVSGDFVQFAPQQHVMRFRTSTEWIQVSNNVKLGQNFVLLDLDPAVWYHLRVTAHNNAGFNVAEYEFATLTVTGGTIAPAREIPKEDTIQIILANLNLVVPVVAAVLVIIVAIIVICVLRGKGNYHKGKVVVFLYSRYNRAN